MATMVFGAKKYAAYGKAQDDSENETAEIAEAVDEDGKTIKQKAYSKNKELQVNVLYDADLEATLPNVGDKVTLDGEDFLVQSRGRSSNQKEFWKRSFTLTRKDAAELEGLTAEAPSGT